MLILATVKCFLVKLCNKSMLLDYIFHWTTLFIINKKYLLGSEHKEV